MRKWMIPCVLLLAVAGCTKHTVRERGNIDIPESHTVETVLNLRSDWRISYKQRETITEEDGRLARVERVEVLCPGADYYIIRSVYADDFRNPDVYNNDRKAFFEEEAGYLRDDAAYWGDKVTDYLFFEEMHEYLFDRMRAGSYLMFLIGMDKDGNITGDYAETAFTLTEETPSEDYLKWLGDWTVGNGTVSYPLTVEQAEANFKYIVRGWETGESIDPAAGTVMDQEWLEADYDFDNGNLYFTSQYLGTYTDGGRDLDEFFLGKVNVTTAQQASDNGIWIITDEGLDLAVAELSDAGASVAPVSGCGVSFFIGNREIFSDFVSMQYIAAYMNGNEVAYDEYNVNVPNFPLTMTRTRSAIARAPWQPRPSTRASIHHAQPRLHTPRGTTRSASAASAGTAASAGPSTFGPQRARHAVRAE